MQEEPDNQTWIQGSAHEFHIVFTLSFLSLYQYSEIILTLVWWRIKHATIRYKNRAWKDQHLHVAGHTSQDCSLHKHNMNNVVLFNISNVIRGFDRPHRDLSLNNYMFSGGNVLFHADTLHFLFPEIRDFPEDARPLRTLLLFLEKQFENMDISLIFIKR